MNKSNKSITYLPMNKSNRLFSDIFRISILFLVLLFGVVHSYVDPMIESEISKGSTVPVIVILKDNTPLSSPMMSDAEKESLIETKRNVYSAAQGRLISSKKLRNVKKQYTSFNGFAADLDSEELSILSSDSTVESVYYDRTFYGATAQAIPLINVTPIYSVRVNGVNSTGVGKTICLIDSGVNYNHTDFGGCNTASFQAGTCAKFVGGYDFVNSDSDPMDDHNHGTHIAGIINRTASGARIAVVKVLNSSNEGLLSNMLAGIDWCNNNRVAYNISVISMSISDNNQYNSSNPCPTWFSASLNPAKSNGIFIAVASGNNHFTKGISSPACEASAFSVGAVYDSNVGSKSWAACPDATTAADQLACFTNYGDNLDLLAPGAVITSTARTGTTLDLAGTSQATPFVAATVAMIQSELAAQGQSLTPDQIYQKLNQTGKRIAVNGNSFPRINGYAFLIASDTFPAVVNYSASAPSDGASYSASTTISIPFSMNKDVLNNSVTFEWNGTNSTVLLQNNSGSFSAQLLNVGTYNYRIWSTDVLGNSGVSAMRSVALLKYPAELVSYWPFDLGAFDLQSLNNGTVYGAIFNQNGGKVAGAYSFDGVNNYISVPSSPSLNLTTGLTISVWVKTNGTGYIIAKSQ